MATDTLAPDPLQDNIHRVRAAINEAALLAGRDPAEVHLVAVSKTKPMALIQAAFAAGQVRFGENRPQELRDKQPLLPEAEWHFIGNLQRKNVKYVVGRAALIHSLDAEELVHEIEKRAHAQAFIQDCLVQVNVSKEVQKGGVAPEQLATFLAYVLEHGTRIRLRGLMAIVEDTDDEATLRGQFATLRELRDQFAPQLPAPHAFTELSMGMSQDFPLAVAEGATLVRVGSAIFGPRT